MCTLCFGYLCNPRSRGKTLFTANLTPRTSTADTSAAVPPCHASFPRPARALFLSAHHLRINSRLARSWPNFSAPCCKALMEDLYQQSETVALPKRLSLKHDGRAARAARGGLPGARSRGTRPGARAAGGQPLLLRLKFNTNAALSKPEHWGTSARESKMRPWAWSS